MPSFATSDSSSSSSPSSSAAAASQTHPISLSTFLGPTASFSYRRGSLPAASLSPPQTASSAADVAIMRTSSSASSTASTASHSPRPQRSPAVAGEDQVSVVLASAVEGGGVASLPSDVVSTAAAHHHHQQQHHDALVQLQQRTASPGLSTTPLILSSLTTTTTVLVPASSLAGSNLPSDTQRLKSPVVASSISSSSSMPMEEDTLVDLVVGGPIRAGSSILMASLNGASDYLAARSITPDRDSAVDYSDDKENRLVTLNTGRTSPGKSSQSSSVGQGRESNRVVIQVPPSFPATNSGVWLSEESVNSSVEQDNDHGSSSNNSSKRFKIHPVPDRLKQQALLALDLFRGIPSRVSALYPSARFVGEQRSCRSRYDVCVTIQDVNFKESLLYGYLNIKGLTDEFPELITFFEGEIIGDKHSFLTRKWGANEQVDREHWTKFSAFRPLEPFFNNDDFRYDFQSKDHIFMRWKEFAPLTGLASMGFIMYVLMYQQAPSPVSITIKTRNGFNCFPCTIFPRRHLARLNFVEVPVSVWMCLMSVELIVIEKLPHVLQQSRQYKGLGYDIINMQSITLYRHHLI